MPSHRKPKDITEYYKSNSFYYYEVSNQDPPSLPLDQNTYRSSIDSSRNTPSSNPSSARLQQNYLKTAENKHKEPSCFEFLNKLLEVMTSQCKTPSTSPQNSPKQSQTSHANYPLNQDAIIL